MNWTALVALAEDKCGMGYTDWYLLHNMINMSIFQSTKIVGRYIEICALDNSKSQILRYVGQFGLILLSDLV